MPLATFSDHKRDGTDFEQYADSQVRDYTTAPTKPLTFVLASISALCSRTHHVVIVAYDSYTYLPMYSYVVCISVV
jgi:hypothetical protein